MNTIVPSPRNVHGSSPVELGTLSSSDHPNWGSLDRELARFIYEMMRAHAQNVSVPSHRGSPVAGVAGAPSTAGTVAVADSSTTMVSTGAKCPGESDLKNKDVGQTATARVASHKNQLQIPRTRSASDALLQGDPTRRSPVSARSRLRFTAAWLAMTFAAGAVCCDGVLRPAPEVTRETKPFVTTNAPVTKAVATWVETVAGYQQLYAREALAVLRADLATSARTIEEIRGQDGLAVRVPDLHSAGLMFKRVQRTRFHGQPMVQIIYLPKKGAPVALFVVKEQKPDDAMSQQRIDEMNVATWRQDNLRYALIGELGIADLTELGKRISAVEEQMVIHRRGSTNAVSGLH